MFYKLDKNTIINTDQISKLEKVEYKDITDPNHKATFVEYELNLAGVKNTIAINKQQYESLCALLLKQKQPTKSAPIQTPKTR